jgi:hypothetical protein
MVPSMVNDLYIIRFAVCAKHATDDDMHVAFHIIQEHADIVLMEYCIQRVGRQSISADSLESAIKKADIINPKEVTAISEETVNSKALPETHLAPPIYPITKVRVNK